MSASRTSVWTWGGKYFGYRDGDELWTHDGKHAGHFVLDAVYDRAGRYLGELRNENRLIRRPNSVATSHGFTPCANRAALAPFADYAGYAMLAGYEDFAGPGTFR